MSQSCLRFTMTHLSNSWCDDIECIAYDARSTLMQGTLTAQQYFHAILLLHVLTLMAGLPKAIFQQCFAKHSKDVTRCLRNITTLLWPVRSPDLSPIDHI
ncbi:hypothetical protein TNCV_479731 [Trichonephila clavipes]|nr:hypothetical protein TNCV_479731 [Trichonephila clavipes]